jgi:hypothetical protein
VKTFDCYLVAQLRVSLLIISVPVIRRGAFQNRITKDISRASFLAFIFGTRRKYLLKTKFRFSQVTFYACLNGEVSKFCYEVMLYNKWEVVGNWKF